MDDGFACRVSETGDTIVVAAQGDLDLATCDQLKDQAAARLRPGARVVVDCSEITFLDSTGLRALLDLRARTAAMGSQLFLAAISSPVQLVLRLSGTEDYFLTLDTWPDAARSSSAPARTASTPRATDPSARMDRPSWERSGNG